MNKAKSFRSLFFIVAIYLIPSISYAEIPPKSFMNRDLFAPGPVYVMVNIEKFVSGIKPGKTNWKKVKEGQWIFDRTFIDDMTNKQKNIKILFIIAPNKIGSFVIENGAIIQRLIIDNQEFTPSQIQTVALQIGNSLIN